MNEQAYRAAEQKLWEFVGVTPDEEWVDLFGVRTRVQVIGDGPPVLFIHGGPNSGSTWANIVEYFEGFRCYLVDRPGTGLSGDYVASGDMYEYGRRFVPDLLDGLGLGRVHVVASSLGGFIAINSCAHAPERFDRMVQMACPAFVPGMKTPSFMKGMAFAPIRWLIGKLPPNEKAGNRILRQIGHGKSIDAGRLEPEFQAWYLDLQRHTNTMRNETAMIAAGVTRKGFRPELTMPDELLSAVTIPTLFLWGEDDGFGGRDVAEHVVSLMPNAELRMLADSGHLPWLDFPETVGRASADFLRTG
jgi:pimeloyl-ACP methyl ester carboxylesterase